MVDGVHAHLAQPLITVRAHSNQRLTKFRTLHIAPHCCAAPAIPSAAPTHPPPRTLPPAQRYEVGTEFVLVVHEKKESLAARARGVGASRRRANGVVASHPLVAARPLVRVAHSLRVWSLKMATEPSSSVRAELKIVSPALFSFLADNFGLAVIFR